MRPLDEGDVGDEPMPEVMRWIDEAIAAAMPEPTAAQLATSADGQPSVRTVLVRRWDDAGLSIFTGLDSAKGRELAADPRCALVLFWHRPLLRQVLVKGAATELSRDEVAEYWSTRARGGQLSAWASDQSRVVPDRAHLDARYAEAEARFESGDVPVPPRWGGFRIEPVSVELWQGHDDRLHDRLRWRRQGKAWVRERLAP